ncbi:GH-E family nuclease [Photobacterium sp. 1_MG-2023]|uniref:GH-E family nuclease n=1 Tax=Photobacterium sp. 1_MG-2023 TaxID=3062646 RepID=UPI0026E2B833|nr:GH-E family nuclease [Photobacterium sp. 1_MG-2023]MDO6709053.1 GH-E family nuclease [Photobacterium sp. 1_MG-2023]
MCWFIYLIDFIKIDEKKHCIKRNQFRHRLRIENRRILRAAEELGMTQEELNDFVNSRPDYFQIEEEGPNLSHRNEKPGYDDLELIKKDMRKFLRNRK